MRCDLAREAISALSDGEEPPPGTSPAQLAAHLARCRECAAFEAGVTELRQLLRPGRLQLLQGGGGGPLPRLRRPPVRRLATAAAAALALPFLALGALNHVPLRPRPHVAPCSQALVRHRAAGRLPALAPLPPRHHG